MSKTTVIAIAHEKGGVGKTTTTVNLGVALVKQGNSVLLVEADPQGDLAKCMGLPEPEKLTETLGKAMDCEIEGRHYDVGECIMPHAEGVYFIPSNQGLAATGVSLVNSPNREHIMHKLIDRMRGDFDYILIDCEPSLGLIVVNALTAADRVLVPVQSHYLAADGVADLFKTIGRVKRGSNPSLGIEGIVMTMCDPRTTVYRDTTTAIKQRYGGLVRVMNTYIPYATKTTKMPVYGKSVFNYNPSGTVAAAYDTLAKEVIANARTRDKIASRNAR